MGLTTVSRRLFWPALRVVFMAAALHFCCCGLPLLARESAPMPAANELDSADSDAQRPAIFRCPGPASTNPTKRRITQKPLKTVALLKNPPPCPRTPRRPNWPTRAPPPRNLSKSILPTYDRPHEAIPETPPESAPDENDTVGGDDITNSGPFAATFDDLPPPAGVKIDAAAFNGVQPGKTTTEELIQLWGEGKVASEARRRKCPQL